MYRPIHPAAPQQRVIGRIHNGIDVLRGDIAQDQFHMRSHRLCPRWLRAFTQAMVLVVG